MSSAILNVPITLDKDQPSSPKTFRLSEQQRNAVAMMAVSGRSAADIARAVGRDSATIRAALREDSDLQARMAHYESKLMKHMAVHHFEMMEMLDQARHNIKEGLHTPDLKTRLDTSWRVLDNVVPQQAQRLDVNMEFSGETNHVVLAGRVSALDKMGELLASQSTGGRPSFLKSVKSELPGPMSLSKDEPVEENS